MALLTPVSTTVRLSFQSGVDAKGNPVLRTRSLNRVKTSAGVQEIYDVAQALASLQEYPLVAVSKVDTSEISA